MIYLFFSQWLAKYFWERYFHAFPPNYSTGKKVKFGPGLAPNSVNENWPKQSPLAGLGLGQGPTHADLDSRLHRHSQLTFLNSKKVSFHKSNISCENNAQSLIRIICTWIIIIVNKEDFNFKEFNLLMKFISLYKV